MYLTFTPPLLPLLFSALVGLALAGYGWRQRRTPGALAFMWLGISVALVSLPEALAVSVARPDYKLLGAALAFPGQIIAPSAWLGFVLRYTGTIRRSWLPSLVMAIEPIVVLVLALTNSAHGLIWQTFAYDPTTVDGVLVVPGPASTFTSVYTCAAGALGVAILAWKLPRRRSFPWRQIGALAVAILVAGVGESGLVGGLLRGLDPTPYVLCGCCLALYWGFLRYRLLELGSVAREAVFDGMGNGVLVLDVFGIVVEVNTVAAEVLGLSRRAVLGQSLSRVIYGRRAYLLEPIISTGSGELLIRPGGGGVPERYYDVQVSSLRRGTQVLPARLVTFSDITERRAADLALRRNEERFRLQYRVSPIPTYCFRRLDQDFVLEDNNAAADELTGVQLGAGDLRGKLATSVLRNIEGMQADVERCWAERTSTRREVRVQVPGGGALDLDVSLAFVPPDLIMLHARDITASKALQQALGHQALHDALTGLPNRVLLNDGLRDAIGRAERDGGHVGLFMLDLDRFKEVNDTLGHSTGDQLLIQVSALVVETLTRIAGANASLPLLVGRLGGDEFAAIVEDVDVDSTQRIANAVLSALRVPLFVDGHAVSAEASIGIALWPDHALDPEVLMRRADIAMYAAKRGRLGSCIYAAEHDHNDPHRMELVTDLRAALEDAQLLLHFQPLVDLASRETVGVEALVRWEHPRRGLVPPDQFIGIAEQNGLIRPLSQWVLNASLAAATTWQARGLRVPVSVNLSAWDLHDLDLPAQVAGLLQTHRLTPDALRIEITESSLMIDPDRACGILEALRRLGVRCSVDDFGTGYSSLSYLKRLPVDSLKIDQSFVQAMLLDGGDRAIVRSTIELAHNLGLQVVAEGVEDELTARLLAELGCDRAQGYLFGLPQPRFEPWLDAIHPDAQRAPRRAA
ncbi:MAG: EAL domain-containing protein [Chloroflexota bacterium]|nr:EAL domain-containing protein [Chloroflexota bacterium]